MDTSECERRMSYWRRQGLAPMAAVHRTLDEAQQSDDTATRFACAAGCAQCCHLLVTCMPLEAAVISSYLESLPQRQRDRIKNRALARARAWQAGQQTLQPGALTADEQDAMLVYEEWMGKPCPFLDEQYHCSIYPARPLSCRVHYSTSVCQKPKWPAAQMLVNEAEYWANNTINRLEMAAGARGTTPLHAWLVAKMI